MDLYEPRPPVVPIAMAILTMFHPYFDPPRSQQIPTGLFISGKIHRKTMGKP